MCLPRHTLTTTAGPVWGPTLVSGTMQGTILATGLYYRCCTGEEPEDVTIAAAAPAEPLLEQRE